MTIRELFAALRPFDLDDTVEIDSHERGEPITAPVAFRRYTPSRGKPIVVIETESVYGRSRWDYTK